MMRARSTGERSRFSKAVLRIYDPALAPDVVTRILRLEPTFAVRAGEFYSQKPGGRGIRGRTGVWLLEIKDRALSPRTVFGADRIKQIDPLARVARAVSPHVTKIREHYPGVQISFAIHVPERLKESWIEGEGFRGRGSQSIRDARRIGDVEVTLGDDFEQDFLPRADEAPERQRLVSIG